MRGRYFPSLEYPENLAEVFLKLEKLLQVSLLTDGKIRLASKSDSGLMTPKDKEDIEDLKDSVDEIIDTPPEVIREDGSAWSVLTTDEPEDNSIVFDSFGQTVMVEVCGGSQCPLV